MYLSVIEYFFVCLQLSEEVGYVLYSALGSFYIPSCIMVFVYIRIYFAAKARARRGIRKPPRRPPQDQVTSFTTAPKTVSGGGSAIDRNSNQSPRGDPDRQIATIESHPIPHQGGMSQPIPIPTVTCDFASDISTCSDAAEIMHQEALEQKDTLKVLFVDDEPRFYVFLICLPHRVRNEYLCTWFILIYKYTYTFTKKSFVILPNSTLFIFYMYNFYKKS